MIPNNLPQREIYWISIDLTPVWW